MKPLSCATVLASAALAAFAPPLAAQTQLFGNHSIVGNLCVGWSCTGAENFGLNDTLKLKYENNAILFDDTSTGAGYANGDWRLRANDSAQFGASHFSLEDVDAGRTVLRVMDGARANALVIDGSGHIGLGTALPAASLHMIAGAAPGLRFEQDGSGGGTPWGWQLAGDDAGFRLHDLTAATTPLTVQPGAPDAALVVQATGWIGLGTATPVAGVHLFDATGDARLRIEETSTIASPRNLLELVNYGRPEITMANTFSGGEWSFGAGTNFLLKQGAVGSPSAAKANLFQIDPAGNATLAGTLTTGGPSCSSGCDAVLAPGYPLLSIADHADAMFTLGHLPNVGPTRPGAPLNLSEQYGRLLNEVEHAHIFIARQQAEIAALRADHAARIAALEARFATLAPAVD